MKNCTTAFALALFTLTFILAGKAQQPASGAPGAAKERSSQQDVPHVTHLTSVHGMPSEELTEASEKRYADVLNGEALLKEGKISTAVFAFKDALTYDSSDITAYRGLANCYTKLGDMAKAIDAERNAVYFRGTTPSVIRETDTSNLMLFASLLDKAGQTAEATTIYNYGASLLKYMDDKPSHGYLMPLFGTEPGQVAYTSARLQALVHVGLGIESEDTQELKRSERLAHLREAVRLYPDSPVVYAYLEYQLRMMGDSAGAKVALNQANRLGLARVSALLDAQTAEMQAQKAPSR